MGDLKGFPDKRTIGESDRHPGTISANIKANREERRAEMSFNTMVTYIQSIDRKLLRKLALMAQ